MLRYQRRFDATGDGLQRSERIDVMAEKRQVGLGLLRKLRNDLRAALVTASCGHPCPGSTVAKYTPLRTAGSRQRRYLRNISNRLFAGIA